MLHALKQTKGFVDLIDGFLKCGQTDTGQKHTGQGFIGRRPLHPQASLLLAVAHWRPKEKDDGRKRERFLDLVFGK